MLSNTILKDFALTNKLLRLVNTAYFRQYGGTISTVSRAVVILGFDRIRSVAMTLMLMDRSEEALPWLQQSLAITPGSGRTYMLLSAVYEQLGRPDEARAAMAKGIALRPGSNLANVALPPRNASPVFIAANEWIRQAYLAAGLPER